MSTNTENSEVEKNIESHFFLLQCKTALQLVELSASGHRVFEEAPYLVSGAD